MTFKNVVKEHYLKQKIYEGKCNAYINERLIKINLCSEDDVQLF
jgi:hypothetical protein